jgi:hypothetical protein
MDTLPAAIAAQGERASRRFIEFFTVTILRIEEGDDVE